MEIVLRTLESQRGALVRALAAAAQDMNWRDPIEKEVLADHAVKTAARIRQIDEALKTLGNCVDVGRRNTKLPAAADAAKEDAPISPGRWDRVFEDHSLLGGR